MRAPALAASDYFGGLARTQDQETFEPWLAHDWTSLGRRLTGGKGSLTFANAFFANLDESRSTLSWGSRIGDAWSRAGLVEGQALLVDFNALDRLGIQATSTQQREESAHAVGSPDHDLILLAHPSVSVLTSRNWAAETLDSSIASSSDRAFPLTDVLAEQVAEGTPFGELISLEGWIASTGFGSTTRALDAAELDLSVTRWTPHGIELPESQSLQLVSIRRPFVVALGYSALLIAGGAAWLCGFRPPLVRLAILGAAAIFALLVPEPLIPLGSGDLFGARIGFASHWVARRASRKTQSSGAIVPTVAPASTIPTAVLLVAWLFASQLGAVEQPATENANTPIFDVLIPTDTQTEPRGKHVYIPEQFYKELIRVTSRTSVNDIQWLITQAHYESPRAENRGANGAAWTARYSLDAFGSSRVRLPLGRSGAHLVPQGATLDEKALQFERDESNGDMTFDVPKAGSYELRVEFVVVPQAEGAPLIEFSIPAIPDSRLLLGTLSGIARPLVNGHGVTTPPTDGDRAICDLGPADKITIRNSEAAQMQQSVEFEATEMFWLHAGPGSLTLQGRWEVNLGRGTVRHLVLKLDPAAHLLPPDESSVISRVRPMTTASMCNLSFANRSMIQSHSIFRLSSNHQQPPAESPGRRWASSVQNRHGGSLPPVPRLRLYCRYFPFPARRH